MQIRFCGKRGNMAQVFISYRRKNWPFTQPLAKDLRARLDASVYVDLDSIDNVQFEQSILPNLRKSNVLLLIVTEQTFAPDRIHKDDDWVRREIREAIKYKIPIILVSVDGVMPPHDLPNDLRTLSNYQAVKFYPEYYNNGLDLLVKFIAGVIPTITLRETNLPSSQHQPSVPAKNTPRSALGNWQWWVAGVFIPLMAALITILPQLMGNQSFEPISEPIEQITQSSNIIRTEIPTHQPTVNTQENAPPTLSIQTTSSIFPTQLAPENNFLPEIVATEHYTVTSDIELTEIYNFIDLVQVTSGITANVQWTPIEHEFDGIVMVLVPAGCFMMGSDTLEEEKPTHEVCVDAFWLDKFEVSQSQFVSNNGVKVNANYFNGANRPIENITWIEAHTYCRDQRNGRLPTEAEWEFSARGPDNLVYPWGDEFVVNNVVSSIGSNSETANVGSKPAGITWVGALDMSGNVWEWVSTRYMNYPYNEQDGREQSSGANARVLRGGSWSSTLLSVRTATRYGVAPDRWNSNFGFRCARDF